VAVVAAALLDPDQRVLLTQRPRGKHLELTWEFPGGKREPGEDDHQALARELREELGVDAQLGPLIARTEHAYERFVVELRLFAGRIVRGTPRALQVADLRWVTTDEMRAMNMPPADGPLVEALVRHLDPAHGAMLVRPPNPSESKR